MTRENFDGDGEPLGEVTWPYDRDDYAGSHRLRSRAWVVAGAILAVVAIGVVTNYLAWRLVMAVWG